MPRPFSVGERVEYADLSPWEKATIVGTRSDITPEIAAPYGAPEEFDFLLQFEDGSPPLPVQEGGIRRGRFA